MISVGKDFQPKLMDTVVPVVVIFKASWGRVLLFFEVSRVQLINIVVSTFDFIISVKNLKSNYIERNSSLALKSFL